jgi:hypothetical protein
VTTASPLSDNRNNQQWEAKPELDAIWSTMLSGTRALTMVYHTGLPWSAMTTPIWVSEQKAQTANCKSNHKHLDF